MIRDPCAQLIYLSGKPGEGRFLKTETLLPLGKLDPGLRTPDAALDVDRVPADAALVEALGYHGLLMEETKDDPFQVLADVVCGFSICVEQLTAHVFRKVE